MSKPSSSEPSRAQLEYQVMASLLRGKKVPLVLDRLHSRLFSEPVLARMVEAVVESYRAQGRQVVNDVKSRLSHKDGGWVDEVITRSAMICDDDELLAALERLEREPPPRESSALGEPSKSSHGCSPLTEFAAERPDWLWPCRVELGRLTLIGGEAGSGKSLVACDLAARVSAGRAWPDGAGATPGSVLLAAPAEDVSDLIRPRLEAAGADVQRVHVLPIEPAPSVAKPGRDSTFKKWLKELGEAVAALPDCRLVLIDPLRLWIGRAQTTIGGDPAAPLELLAAFARRQQVTVLGVTAALYEDRRRNSLGDALKLATGACTATAWQVARHPQLKHVRLFLPAKTTRSSDLEGLAFTVIDESAGERVEWQGVRIPADLLDAHPRGDAVGWLRQALACGPLASKEILELGGENGYTPRMLHYAREAAGVAVKREGFGRGATWRWALDVPADAQLATA